MCESAQSDCDRDALIVSHLTLVDAIARSLACRLPPSFDVADLAATGYVALIAAADAYRPGDHGNAPFSVFARQKVRGAMIESVRRRNWTANTCAALDEVTEPAFAPSLDALDERRQWLHVIAAAEWLSFHQRAILAARYSPREASWAEIAAELKMSDAWVYAQHAAAIKELKKRCAGEIPVARRLVGMATPKLSAVKNPHAAALALKVKPLADEIGDIEKALAPYELQIARLPLLRKALRECYDDSPAAGTFEAAGDRFLVMVGARGKQSVVNIPKLIKAIGARAFAAFATVTLKDLETHASCSVRADVVTVTQTGPRSLVTVERGMPELPKAA